MPSEVVMKYIWCPGGNTFTKWNSMSGHKLVVLCRYHSLYLRILAAVARGQHGMATKVGGWGRAYSDDIHDI